MMRISWRQALGWRLRRQYLTEASSGLVATASRLLGAATKRAAAASAQRYGELLDAAVDVHWASPG